ncbi:MAG: hypothetical protein QXZ41_03835 [Ignisphaera sp.]|uniref:Uncharacterized protein n=1 Tax=Ignisphaera aggregans TaxID=334771 RepID=A0A7C4JKM2_9CREN
MSKDTIMQCLNKASAFLELISTCNDCAEFFIDYNPLRYPYISLLIMLIKCDNIIENCYNHLFDGVIEATIDISSVLYGVTNLEKDFVNFRIKCDEGWLEYGYVPARSMHLLPYVVKGFTVTYSGRRFVIESMDTNFINKLHKFVDALVKKASTIIDQEGLM